MSSTMSRAISRFEYLEYPGPLLGAGPSLLPLPRLSGTTTSQLPSAASAGAMFAQITCVCGWPCSSKMPRLGLSEDGDRR